MDNCCICFGSDLNSVKINGTLPKNDISIKRQLERLVPEVIWLEDYTICCKCQDRLNLIQEFLEQCLHSQRLREMEIKVEEPTIKVEYSPQSPTNSPNSDLKDPLALDKSDLSNDHKKVCNYCGKSFKKQNYLTMHEKIHLNKREYECKLCKQQFNTHKTLFGHNLVKHTDPENWRYQCNICNKRFPRRGNYDRHVKIHRNIKDVKCHLCGKEFKSKIGLKVHLIVHTNERKFGCEICGKAFSSQVILKNHLYVHTDEQHFQCDLCGTKFKQKRSMKHHMVKFHQQTEEEDNRN